MAVAVAQSEQGPGVGIPIPDVARYLLEVLGPRLTAVIGEVQDARVVRQWAKGQHLPPPEVEQRLRHAFEATQLLMKEESPETVRAWFLGMNPELGDEVPALVLATDPAAVLDAARVFLAHG